MSIFIGKAPVSVLGPHALCGFRRFSIEKPFRYPAAHARGSVFACAI
ncbi:MULTISPECIES: hypothetical protein [unclassified Xanthobacter]|nr:MULTISPECIES: hypothetical protein [unclassified Xanthobacter]